MTILVLMAGGDDAFLKAGYLYPKNLTVIRGRILAERVLDGLGEDLGPGSANLVCAIRKEEHSRFYTGDVVRRVRPDAKIVQVPRTAGAVCTALLCIDQIPKDGELLIVNGDILLDTEMSRHIKGYRQRGLDGGLIVFRDIHPRWSFAKLDGGFVVEVAEKRPISEFATAGFYYFSRASAFFSGAFESLARQPANGGSYFVAPVYNECILEGARIGVSEVNRSKYHSLSTPESVREYERYIDAGA